MGKHKKNPHVGSSFDDFLEEEKQSDPRFAAALDEQFDRLELARAVRHLRGTLGLSQAELAERVGTKQPGIARLESGRVVPKLELLQKIATAAGRKLEVRFGPRKAPKKSAKARVRLA